MPKFKKNPNPIMKRSGFKMKGYSYPGTSPFEKDVKMYDGNGKQVMIDDSKLGEQYLEDDGNKSRDHENGDVLYLTKPRFNQSKEGPVLPSDRPIENKPSLA